MPQADSAADSERLQVEASRRQSILYDALTPRRLFLTLFPTEKCNFRCKYCYVNFVTGRMPADVVNGVKLLIAARAPELELLHLSWSGGEPFTAYDIVKEIMEIASEASATHGVHLVGRATTNGYDLGRARFVELESLGLRKYEIALDGDKEGHDRTRPRMDGAGTFDGIWSNLLLFNDLCSKGTLALSKVTLWLQVHPKNVASIERLADLILGNLDPRFFAVRFRSIVNYASEGSPQFDAFQRDDEARASLLGHLEKALRRYLREPSGEVEVCSASKANHFLIRADGSIGKCTVSLGNPSNAVGKIRRDGSMDLDPSRFGFWLEGLRSMNKEHLACPATRLTDMHSGARG